MKIFILGGTSVEKSSSDYDAQCAILESSMEALGRSIVESGHNLLVCSPFAGAADVFAVDGARYVLSTNNNKLLEYHYPDDGSVIDMLRTFVSALPASSFHLYSHPVIRDEAGQIEWTYSWLVSQLAALKACHAVIALGGATARSASLLLKVAAEQSKPLLPLTFLEGAAAGIFEHLRYPLRDRLGDDIDILNDPTQIERAVELAERLASGNIPKGAVGRPRRCFVSYSRSRPAEADFVEVVLRRRNVEVYRDDRDFEPGSSILGEITGYIHHADIFISLWCQEYACSPWCFDELSIALQRHKAGKLSLWIFSLDQTRIVPPDARDIITYPIRNREELEGRLLALLESKA